MTTHVLKTWPGWFEPIRSHKKRFEVRLNDRDFQTGDTLYLQEWDPRTEQYTGRHEIRLVTFVLQGPSFGIEQDYVVMSIDETKVVEK